jgi:hypothetical protein
MATERRGGRKLGRLAIIVSLVTGTVLATSTVAEAALVSGSLPAAGFTYLATSQNAVNISGDVRLKIKENVTVKTTYSIVTPADQIVGGWHYHLGPVIVTVTAGTLTFFGEGCGTWDVSAGESYIETPGQILNAKTLIFKNSGNVEWITTRLLPAGATDPVTVDAPCVP